MNRKTGSLFRNTRFMIRNSRCMTRIMWLYDSKYGPHESKNGGFMTRQTGSLFRNTRFMNRKTGPLFQYESKYQIYYSTYRVINFFRDPEWHPPRRRFVESYFYHLAPGREPTEDGISLSDKTGATRFHIPNKLFVRTTEGNHKSTLIVQKTFRTRSKNFRAVKMTYTKLVSYDLVVNRTQIGAEI